MKGMALTGMLLISGIILRAQVIPQADTATTLQEVIVRGFENNRRLVDVPASVNLIRSIDLNRYNNTSLVQAMNIFPGVRMEERSPGSYRLNLRGSSLRSPFGVRNVKVYYNDIPYTDAGGNTYLNVLGFYNVGSVEILKGPGGSLYGAGTGGVIRVNNSIDETGTAVKLNASGGSYGMWSYGVEGRTGNEGFMNRVAYQQQRSDGYRDHTNLNRKVLTWDTRATLSNGSQLQSHFLYGDLYYQTPGALNATEYANNPKAARPAGAFPSPQQAKAAVYTKLFLAGLSYQQQLSTVWKLNGSLYGAFSELKNPTIRNYERKTEPNTGGRLMITGSWEKGFGVLSWNSGVELQKGFGSVRVTKNNNGNPDSLQTDDELRNLQYFIFTQVNADLRNHWNLSAGVSLNESKVDFSRLLGESQSRRFGSILAPRIALSKSVNKDLSVYATLSRGFSPPSSSEYLPSTGILSKELEAESGYNYETGIKGSVWKDLLFFDVNVFYFQLNNTIVQRRDASNADYFVNAGSTRQVGVESFFQYRLLSKPNGFLKSMLLYGSYTYSHFRYHDYRKDTVNYSGNSLPSVTPHAVSAGLDINTRPGLYARLTYYYNDPIPLNDANTAYSSSFNLAGARIGLRRIIALHHSVDLFGSVDNLFDVKYSLGNDINAAAGRYYNAAPGRNFAVGFTWGIE